MGRLRRRKRKYTWFPQIGTQGASAEDDTTILSIAIPQTSGTLLSDVNIFPIIPDVPLEGLGAAITPGANTSLVNFIASEYFLKRIVGKFACSLNPLPATTGNQIQAATIGCGFLIARAAEAEVITGGPIGASTAAERKQNYGPLNVSTTREPWIWRRTWTMSPIVTAASGVQVWGNPSGSFPPHNMQGSVAEGSQIDARTARRVGNDDRLFFAVQTAINDQTGTPATYTFPDGILDIRILGALRRARNRSVF